VRQQRYNTARGVIPRQSLARADMLWSVDSYYGNQVFLSVGSYISQLDVVGIPKISLTTPNATCVAAENNGSFLVLTFSSSVGAGTKLQVPVQDPAVRNIFGGYLSGGSIEIVPPALIAGYSLMTASGPITTASVEAHAQGADINLTLPLPSRINETRTVGSWQNSTHEVKVRDSGGTLIANIAIGEAYSFVWTGSVWDYFILNGY
jgi:hypothetical protein